jgi:hypothetical protein
VGGEGGEGEQKGRRRGGGNFAVPLVAVNLCPLFYVFSNFRLMFCIGYNSFNTNLIIVVFFV